MRDRLRHRRALGPAALAPAATALLAGISFDSGHFRHASTCAPPSDGGLAGRARRRRDGGVRDALRAGARWPRCASGRAPSPARAGRGRRPRPDRDPARDDYAAVGGGEDETEGIVESLRAVGGVEVAALVKEQSRGPRVRVSLRSNDVDVSAVAAAARRRRPPAGRRLLQRRQSRGGDRMAQFRTRKAPLDGVLLIDKPEGLTSHDVVARVRRALRPARQEGRPRRHARPVRHRPARGARRPRDASSRRFFVDLPKEYECTMQFGVRSDTGDLTGELGDRGRRPADASRPSCRASSARSCSRCHDLRRQGRTASGSTRRRTAARSSRRPSRRSRSTPSTSSTSTSDAQTMRCRIACSKGTYVRQLAIDIGEAVGAGAHLRQLSRTATGDLQPRRRPDPRGVRRGGRGARAGRRAHPGPASRPAAALQFMPAIELSAAQVTAVRNGARLPGGPQEPVRLTYRGELIADLRAGRGGPRPQAARQALMRVVTDLGRASSARPRAVAIGTFDGVHVGHRAVIGRAVALAAERGLAQRRPDLRPAPAGGRRPGHVPRLLTPLAEKIRLIERARPRRARRAAVRRASSRRYARPSSAATCSSTRSTRAVVVVGENFNFGAGGAGDAGAAARLRRRARLRDRRSSAW